MVKRLRRSPLKAESGVRFSVGLPKEKAYPFGYAFSFARGERTTEEFGSATVAKRRCFSVANGYPIAVSYPMKRNRFGRSPA